MKKISLLLLLVSNSYAADLNDWYHEYQLLNSCGQELTIIHEPEQICLILEDSYPYCVSEVDLQDRLLYGCTYDIQLSANTSKAEFEQTMLNSGFTIVSSKALSA